MRMIKISPDNAPMDLLLAADPSPDRVADYLLEGSCYAVIDESEHQQTSDPIAICVVNQIRPNTAEIMNISVAADYQQQGIGAKLLAFVLDELRLTKQIQTIELGTGAFGHQLAFYQRFGFRVHEIWKDHFLKHYTTPLFENGIQHKDMIRLRLSL